MTDGSEEPWPDRDEPRQNPESILVGRSKLLAQCPGVEEIFLVPLRLQDGADCQADTWKIIAYVVPEIDAAAIDRELKDTWRVIYGELAALPDRDPVFDTSGWNSSLSGDAYPIEEIEEYVSSTVDIMLEGSPRSVLDIGCGTGMPLLRVAPTCQRYVGLDQSAATLENLEPVIQRAGLSQVKLVSAEASDISSFGDEKFDLITCNSASQHFPGVDYLAQVLRKAMELLTPGGRIVLTDVRDLTLETEFHSSVVCAQAAESLPRDALMDKLVRRRLQERELFIDPRWFPLEFRDAAVVIEIRPRRGHFRNETTTFHYDVVLHQDRNVEFVSISTWLDWHTDSVDLKQVGRIMCTGTEAFGLLSIPNVRTEKATALAERINGLHPMADRHGATSSVPTAGIDPEALIALASEHGYDCHLSRINARPHGAFDAAMVRSQQDRPLRERLPDFANSAIAAEPHASLSTDPRRYHMVTMARATLTPVLRRFADAHLAEHERPDAYVIVPELPWREGKVDLEALPSPRLSRRSGGRLRNTRRTGS